MEHLVKKPVSRHIFWCIDYILYSYFKLVGYSSIETIIMMKIAMIMKIYLLTILEMWIMIKYTVLYKLLALVSFMICISAWLNPIILQSMISMNTSVVSTLYGNRFQVKLLVYYPKERTIYYHSMFRSWLIIWLLPYKLLKHQIELYLLVWIHSIILNPRKLMVLTHLDKKVIRKSMKLK